MPHKTSKSFYSIAILAATGCNGAGETIYKQQWYLKCVFEENNTTTTEEYCITERKGCPTPTALEACSWNHYNDLVHDSPTYFSPVELYKASCEYQDWMSGSFPPDPTPGSSCGSPDYSSSGGGGSADGGSGATDGTPTSGSSEPTSGGSTGESTGGSEKELYLCALNVPDKCADLVPDNVLAGQFDDPYVNPNTPDDAEKDACWGKIDLMAPSAGHPILSPCVEAETATLARALCDQLCDDFQDNIDDKVQALCGVGDPNCKVETEIDCAMDGQVGNPPAADSWDAPHKLSETPGWACDGPPMVPAWEGYSQHKLFDGSATLATADGLIVGLRNLSGFFAYSVPTCPAAATQCVIQFDALQLLNHQGTGRFVEADGDGGPFTVDRIGFQTRNIFSGIWTKTRGTISFPTAVIQAQIWAGETTIDGSPVLGIFEPIVVEVDQIVGNLQSIQGPLNLNLVYNSPEGTVALSLQGR